MNDQVIEEDVIEIEIEQFPDGIYLHMDEDVYHAQHRLSSSHIANLLVSEGDFWANSWLNPNRKDKVTQARLLGRAYHTARLEPQKLHERFVRQIDEADFPGALMNDIEVKAALKAMMPQPEDHPEALMKDTDVKAALKDLGLPQSKAGETQDDRKARLREASAAVVFWSDVLAEWEAEHGPIAAPADEGALDRAKRLRSYGYEGAIWCLKVEKFEADLAGRMPLMRSDWDQINADIETMKGSAIAGRFLTGGLPEVTVMWTHASGVKVKARIDYLRPDLFTDVKTFDNPRKKPYQECIFDAVRYNGYYRQFRFYHDACEAIRLGDLDLKDSEDVAALDIIRAIRDHQGPIGAATVFQQKGGVPNIYGCPVRIKKTHASLEAAKTGDPAIDDVVAQKYADWTLFAMKAAAEIDTAIMLYMRCMKSYGPDKPWQPLEPIFDIDDNSFNGFWLDPDHQTEDIIA